MNNFSFRRLKSQFDKFVGHATVPAIIGDGNDPANIYDPSIPGNVFVQIQYANGYGQPISVRGPMGTTVQLVSGTLVDLYYTTDRKLAIKGYNVPGGAIAGTDMLAPNVPILPSSSYVGQQSIVTALVQPQKEPDLTVVVLAWAILSAGTYTEFPGSDDGGLDMSSFVPSTGDNLYAVVFIESDFATLLVATSTARSTADLPLGADDIQEALTAGYLIDPDANALAVVRLYGDQTEITSGDIQQDLRQFLNLPSAGGSGDVSGPGSSTTDDIATYADTTGKVIKDGGKKITDLALGAGSSTTNDFVQFTNTDGRTLKDGGISLDTDGTFAANSNSRIPSQAATKTYTDNAVLNAINGLAPKADLALWTNAALPAIVYLNGSSGVGATLTGVSTGVLTVDGVAVTLGMRIGIKDQVTQFQNGIYVVTTAGAIGVAFVLTRTTDANTSAELIGAYAFALQGTVNADTAYICTNSSAITIGTTAIVFGKFLGAGINQLTGGVTAGPGTGSQVATLPAKFIVQTADANLTNAQALSTLTTGIVKVTTTTGVLSTATAGTDYTSPTGTENLSNKTITASSLIATALSILIGGFKGIFTHANTADRTYTFKDASGTVAFTSDIPAAAITQLTGDVTAGPGSGSQAATLATVNSNVGTFSRVKSVTANAKGLITAITQGLVDLTAEVTGILPVANGGTGLGTLTAHDLLVGAGTSVVTFLAPGSKGNVIASNATDYVNVAVGSDGQGIIAQAAQTPGLYWRDVLYPPNALINGGFDLISRQALTPTTQAAYSNDTYGPDQWNILTQTASVNYFQGIGDTHSLNSGALLQNQASAQRFGIEQILESVVSLGFRSRPVRYKARIKISNSQAIRIALVEWTGTADAPTSNIVRDWTNGTYTSGQFFLTATTTIVGVAAITPSSATWTDISVTGTVSSSCNNLIAFIWTEGTAATNFELQVTEAGVYDGVDPVPWMPLAPAQESLRAQRFLKVLFSANTVKTRLGMGHANTTTNGIILYTPNVPFRITPALTATGSDWQLLSANTGIDATAISITAASTADAIEFAVTVAAVTAAAHVILQGDGSADRYLVMSAEL